MKPGTIIKLTAVLSLALTTGCATTNSVLAKEPEEIIRVAQPPQEVAQCLSKSNNRRTIERADGALVVRIRDGYGGVDRAFSIYPDGAGSKVEVRKSLGWQPVAFKRCLGLEKQS